MADAVLNLQGIKIHVGYYRSGRLYKVDEADCYVTNDVGQLVAQIDNIDLLGEFVTKRSWLSLRTIAEMHADEHASEWERAERLQAQADAVEARQVA